MKANEVLNRVKELLGMEVKLATMKLSDGVTVLEAEVFDAGAEIFIVAEDGQKIPLPVGEYELEDGRILVTAHDFMKGRDDGEEKKSIEQYKTEHGDYISKMLGVNVTDATDVEVVTEDE